MIVFLFVTFFMSIYLLQFFIITYLEDRKKEIKIPYNFNEEIFKKNYVLSFFKDNLYLLNKTKLKGCVDLPDRIFIRDCNKSDVYFWNNKKMILKSEGFFNKEVFSITLSRSLSFFFLFTLIFYLNFYFFVESILSTNSLIEILSSGLLILSTICLFLNSYFLSFLNDLDKKIRSPLKKVIFKNNDCEFFINYNFERQSDIAGYENINDFYLNCKGVVKKLNKIKLDDFIKKNNLNIYKLNEDEFNFFVINFEDSH